MQRAKVLEELARQILLLNNSSPVRVGIDGVGAAGKTIFADQLGELLSQKQRQVIRTNIDSFHNPREIRTQRGELCPQGYYHDSFDYSSLKSKLLQPLGPDGSHIYQKAKFDFRSESQVDAPFYKAETNSILIFEGVFLFRPELIDYWDFKIFIHADFKTTLKRALNRDLSLFGSTEKILSKYHHRYIPGQSYYLDTVKPHKLADITIDNNDFEHPQIKSDKSVSMPKQKQGVEIQADMH